MALINGKYWCFAFQSPRSGKFVSDNGNAIGNTAIAVTRFQSPRSGKFVSDNGNAIGNTAIAVTRFQSPRSGKFVSDIKDQK